MLKSLGLIVLAYVLVWAIYNPLGVSYVDWLMDTPADQAFLYKLLAGLLLLALLFAYVRMTYRNLSWTLIFIAAPIVVVGLIVVNEGLVAMTGEAVRWFLMLVVPLLLGLGTAWGFFYRWAVGVTPTDDVED